METYLVHHGIKNQKWGVRRYQNEDGSWTEAGLRHRNRMYTRALNQEVKKTRIATDVRKGYTVGYEAKGRFANAKDTISENRPKGPLSKAEISAINQGVRGTKNIVDSARRGHRDSEAAKAKISALDEAKAMTDEQLKERISRLNLENNYVSAISQQQVSNGSDTVDRILAVTGTVLGIAATGVGIWATLKKG